MTDGSLGQIDAPQPPTPRHSAGAMIARGLENFLSASRWLLAPFYVVLVLSLGALLVKMVQMVVAFVPHVWEAKESAVLLETLGLIDLTLTASLIIIVVFSGYTNFVTKIDATKHSSWPEWTAKIDFAGLKLKLMSTIVAISAIQLLRAFVDVQNLSDRELYWNTGIHLVFVLSTLLLAWTDRVSSSTEH